MSIERKNRERMPPRPRVCLYNKMKTVKCQRDTFFNQIEKVCVTGIFIYIFFFYILYFLGDSLKNHFIGTIYLLLSLYIVVISFFLYFLTVFFYYLFVLKFKQKNLIFYLSLSLSIFLFSVWFFTFYTYGVLCAFMVFPFGMLQSFKVNGCLSIP